MDAGSAVTQNGDDQLVELLGLIEGADTVELKLTVPDADRRETLEALGVDPLDSVLRQIYFFDTRELDLEDAGLVVRARRTQGKPDDSVVKLRPVVPGEAFDAAARSRSFLHERGVSLSGEQQTKTRTALEFFATE
jgi:hypothetical protein